jgi:hypothetical protein
MPLSSVTVGFFEDLYGTGNVDYLQADAFPCPSGALSAQSAEARAWIAAMTGSEGVPFPETDVLFPIGSVPLPGV